jgi:transcriptional regulator with XRE-family HTH domain
MAESRIGVWVKFGERVRRLRRQQSLSLVQLSGMTSFSSAYLGKIENATRRPNREVAGALDRALGTDGALLREWSEVLRSESSPEWFEQSREYERKATEIRFFHPFLIPGFFQTPDYARIITSHSKPDENDSIINSAIDARKAWYNDLRETQTRLSVVIPEAVLRRRIGSLDIMGDQIARLLDEASVDLFTIQVLPDDSDDHAWTAGAFRIICMSDQHMMVCVEHTIGEVLSDKPSHVSWLGTVFGKMQAWALPPTASIRLMKEIISNG